MTKKLEISPKCLDRFGKPFHLYPYGSRGKRRKCTECGILETEAERGLAYFKCETFIRGEEHGPLVLEGKLVSGWVSKSEARKIAKEKGLKLKGV